LDLESTAEVLGLSPIQHVRIEEDEVGTRSYVTDSTDDRARVRVEVEICVQ